MQFFGQDECEGPAYGVHIHIFDSFQLLHFCDWKKVISDSLFPILVWKCPPFDENLTRLKILSDQEKISKRITEARTERTLLDVFRTDYTAEYQEVKCVCDDRIKQGKVVIWNGD